MTKTTSRIVFAGVALLAIAAVAAGVVLNRLDRMIEGGVESAGPRLTGTDVDLGSADVSVFSGEGALNDLIIGNPEGFSGDDAFNLGRVAVAVDLKSLTSDVVRIRSVVIDGPRLLAEFNAAGRNNLNAILDHVRAAARGGGKKGDAREAEDTRLIIDEFRFENAELRALSPTFKLDKTLKLPPVVLKNLGAKQGGVAASDLASQVLRPIVDSAVQAAMKEYVAAQRGKLGEKAKEELFDKVFKQ